MTEQQILDALEAIQATLDQENRDPTQAESDQIADYKRQLQIIRNPPPPPETLDQAKTRKKNEIDGKTSELITAGYTYDSTVFSSSEHAQSRWTALYAKRLDAGKFPINVP